MSKILRQAFRWVTLITILMTSNVFLEGLEYVWGGQGSTSKTSHLNEDSNWHLNTKPIEEDDVVFSGAGNLHPLLPNGDSFSANQMIFQGANPYHFTINGQLNFNKMASSSSYTSGVQNLGSAQQYFEIYEDGEISFGKNANAAFGKGINVDTVSYTLGDVVLESSGTMTFNDNAAAGGAEINMYEDSTLILNDVSTLDEANLIMTGNATTENCPTLMFNNGANAGTSTITSRGSNIAFAGTSTADFSLINLQGETPSDGEKMVGTIDFYQMSSAGNASINVVDGSVITFFDNTAAENAKIELGNDDSNGMPTGSVDFLDESSAQHAVINVYGGCSKGNKEHRSSLIFDDYSHAGSARINLGDNFTGFGGNLSFFRFAHADSATINADQSSSIVFNDHANANNAIFTLNDDSSLTFKGASSSANSTINLASPKAVLNFGPNGTDTFGGIVTGNGTINITGSGVLSFFGNSHAFTGMTNILQGTLSIKSSLPGKVIVHQGGTLGGGEGTLLGDVLVAKGAQVAPGVGTVNINGDYVQEADSIYQLQINRSGTSSLIKIEGTATLNPGAKINVAATHTASQLPPNKEVEVVVLQAKRGIVGNFSQMGTSNPLIVAKLGASDANIIKVVFSNALSMLAKTHNQKVVSNQLQGISDPTSSQSSFLNVLASLPSSEGRHVLDQLSAEEYANIGFIAELSNQLFIQRLYDPLRSLVVADPCLNPCDNRCDCKGWELWMDGGFVRNTIDGNKNAKGFHTRGYDFTIGAQGAINREWVLGTALSFERNHLDYHLGGRGRNYSVLGGIYGLYRPESYYILSDLLVGYTKHTLNRFIAIGPVHSRMEGHPGVFQGAYYVEAGKDYHWNCILFQPFLGLEADYFHLKRTKEFSRSDLFNVVIREKSRAAAFSRLGLHLTTERYWGVTLAVDLAWRFRFTSLDNHIDAHFKNFGDEFKVDGVDIHRNSLDGTVNLSATLCNGWDVFIEGSAQWWQRATSFNFLAGLQIDW